MATWNDWTPDVAIDVPGCPAPTIEKAVRDTVIDFLERTHWLQRTVAPIDIAGGAALRTFPSSVVATGECVLAVLKAWIDGEEAPVWGPPDVEDDWPDWKTITGAPEGIVMESLAGYYVVPSPTATMTAALRLKVAVGLTEASTTCDDLIRRDWRDTIGSGAKARLLFMQEKPWSEAQLGGGHQAIYKAGVDAACLRAIRTPARRPLQTKPYWF